MALKNMIYKKITAFSLAEALISMMIIMITVMCAAPILTKQKNASGLKNITIKGSYTCFPVSLKKLVNINTGEPYNSEDGENGYMFRSLYCEEGNCKFSKDLFQEGCEMKTNPRPANYLIISAGAGYYDGYPNNSDPGQVKTLYKENITGTLKLYPGVKRDLRTYVRDEYGKLVKNTEVETNEAKYYNDNSADKNRDKYGKNFADKATLEETPEEWESRISKFQINNSTEFEAFPGYRTDNGLVKDIIKEVVLLSGTVGGKPVKKCDNIKISDDSDLISIQCKDSGKEPLTVVSEDGAEPVYPSIKVSELKKCDDENNKCGSSNGDYYYDGTKGTYVFNIVLKDSNYKPRAEKRSFRQILSTISALRWNQTYYNYVINPNFGGAQMPGAITVLW